MVDVKKLVCGLTVVAALLPAARGYASQAVDQELQVLAGHWEGDGQDGSKVDLTVSMGQNELVATGSWKVDGGALAGGSDFSILHTENAFYMIGDKSPFTAGQEAYTMVRFPGGMKFVRLAHPADAAGAVQSEEIEFGKVRANGTRTMKLVRGERLCSDPASPAGKPCGQAVTETIVIRKVN